MPPPMMAIRSGGDMGKREDERLRKEEEEKRDGELTKKDGRDRELSSEADFPGRGLKDRF